MNVLIDTNLSNGERHGLSIILHEGFNYLRLQIKSNKR